MWRTTNCFIGFLRFDRRSVAVATDSSVCESLTIRGYRCRCRWLRACRCRGTLASTGGMGCGELSAGHRADNRQLAGQRHGRTDLGKLPRMPATRAAEHRTGIRVR